MSDQYDIKRNRGFLRRINWFVKRRDYWLQRGDLQRAMQLDRLAVEELAAWRQVSPLASLIEEV